MIGQTNRKTDKERLQLYIYTYLYGCIYIYASLGTQGSHINSRRLPALCLKPRTFPNQIFSQIGPGDSRVMIGETKKHTNKVSKSYSRHLPALERFYRYLSRPT